MGNTPSQATETKGSSNTKNTPFKIQIAISFDADGCALAFSYNGKVSVYNKWKAKKRPDHSKLSTQILLENDVAIAFGDDAERMYSSSSKKKTWKYFDTLHATSLAGNEVISTNGLPCDTKVLFREYFGELKKKTDEYVKKLSNKQINNDSETQWILIIPSTANCAQPIKNKVKECMIEAKLIDENISNQCIFVNAFECVPLSLLNPADDIKQDYDEILTIGDTYIILHGIDKVSIGVCNIDIDGSVVDIIPSTIDTNLCGDFKLFEKLLTDIFGKEGIDYCKKEVPIAWITLMNGFVQKTKRFDESKNDTVPIQLPYNFIQCLEQKCQIEDKIHEYVNPLQHFRNLFTEHDQKNGMDEKEFEGDFSHFSIRFTNCNNRYFLELDIKIVKCLMDSKIDQISMQMQTLLKKIQTLGIELTCLCLVGSLLSVAYFRKQMMNIFGPNSKYKLKVIIPHSPAFCVVTGATQIIDSKEKIIVATKQLKNNIIEQLFRKSQEIKQKDATINTLSTKLQEIQTENKQLKQISDFAELETKNNGYAQQIIMLKAHAQDQDKQIYDYKQKIDTLNTRTENDEHAECEEIIQSLQDDLEKAQQNFSKYIEKKKQVTSLSKEKRRLENQNNALIERNKELEDKLKQMEMNEAKSPVTNQQMSASYSSISAVGVMEDDDYDDYDDEKKSDEIDYSLLTKDDLCNKLQHDLENYIHDQKNHQKKVEIHNLNKLDKQKKLLYKELKIFHDEKAEIMRHWTHNLKRNDFKNLCDKLLEELEDKYDYEDSIEESDIDAEQLAYRIVFDTVIECYDVLHSEYNKIHEHEYINPNVIDMTLLNISQFYDLDKLMTKKGKLKSLKKRIENIHRFINDKIEKIYKRVQKKHMNDVNEHIKDELCDFIVKCSELVWGLRHYDCTVYPENFLLNASDTKYDENIHEKQLYKGNKIQYCVFPAIKDKKQRYKTKIWVICNAID